MQLIHYPSKALDVVCKSVDKVLSKHLQQASRMHQIMLKEKGVGLSAPQVGLQTRIIVINTMVAEVGGVKLTMFNPIITWKSAEVEVMKEGCLSFPGTFIDVKRAKEIKVVYLDGQNQEIIKHLTGLAAQAVQHEVDHLDGILYISKQEN